MKTLDSRKEKDQSREVSTARGRLEGALQVLADRTESEDSDLESDLDVGDFGSRDSKRTPLKSPMVSPRKSTPMVQPSSSRKRKRMTPKEKPSEHQSFVLKLYDRSVDLANFLPNSPLYPVCRAWIKNDPGNPNLGNKKSKLGDRDTKKLEDDLKGILDSQSNPDDNELRDVYSLPAPEPLPRNEQGDIVDLRIPQNIEPPTKSASLDFLTQEASTSDKELLGGHLQRWWEVRRQWRRAASLNESRYSKSIKLIKEIFDRNSN